MGVFSPLDVPHSCSPLLRYPGGRIHTPTSSSPMKEKKGKKADMMASHQPPSLVPISCARRTFASSPFLLLPAAQRPASPAPTPNRPCLLRSYTLLCIQYTQVRGCLQVTQPAPKTPCFPGPMAWRAQRSGAHRCLVCSLEKASLGQHMSFDYCVRGGLSTPTHRNRGAEIPLIRHVFHMNCTPCVAISHVCGCGYHVPPRFLKTYLLS